MVRYSAQPSDRIFEKGYGFLSFAKSMGKNIDENISQILSSKYSQKILNHDKQSATDTLKTALKRAIQKTEEEAGDLNGSKIDDRIMKISKSLQQLQMIMIKKYLKKDVHIYIYIYYIYIYIYIYIYKQKKDRNY